MFIVTGFGDEISPDLNEQVDVLNQEGIKYLEIRGVWGKNILDISDNEAGNVKTVLDKNNIKISAIGSPIGKIDITDSFETHLVKFRRAIVMAKFFNTTYIRIFSYYNSTNVEFARYRSEVMKRMKIKTEIAEKENIILLHENETGIYGNTADRCKDILDTVNSKNLRAIFDPANFIAEKQKPYIDCFNKLVDYTVYLHIKDAVWENGNFKVVPSGDGEGQIKEILSGLKQKGFSGFLSLEPHLQAAGKMSGFSGPDLFRIASKALKKIVNEIG